MLGRGSRSRGVCEGILYVITKDKGSVVIDKLKKKNFAMFDDLKNLMKLLEKRYNDQLLVTALKTEMDEGNMIKSLS